MYLQTPEEVLDQYLGICMWAAKDLKLWPSLGQKIVNYVPCLGQHPQILLPCLAQRKNARRLLLTHLLAIATEQIHVVVIAFVCLDYKQISSCL